MLTWHMRPAYEWHMPAAMYEWDLDSDRYRLVRVLDTSVLEPLPKTLTLKSLRDHHLVHDRLQSLMLQLPFLVLRERHQTTVCYASGKTQVQAFSPGPSSDSFHIEDGYMLLHYESTIASYEGHGPAAYVGSTALLSDSLRLPVALQRFEVPHYLSVRRRSITKQLQDRRVIVQKGGLLGAYCSGTMQLLKPAKRRDYH